MTCGGESRRGIGGEAESDAAVSWTRRRSGANGMPPAPPLVNADLSYLSMSPTTKKNEPRMATMSATSVPGSSSTSAWMLLNDAERSLRR